MFIEVSHTNYFLCSLRHCFTTCTSLFYLFMCVFMYFICEGCKIKLVFLIKKTKMNYVIVGVLLSLWNHHLCSVNTCSQMKNLSICDFFPLLL